jgi:hypothetical protein
MPSGIKKHGLNAPSALSAAIPPAPVADNAADTSLSPAFRNVLGSRGRDAHLPALALTTAHEIAKRAKTEKPSANPKGAPRSTHVGPRSGHK